MTRAQLKASRALWRRRELSRKTKLDKANTKVDKTRYQKLYDEAHSMRVKRDKQLADLKPEYAHLVDDAGVALVAGFEGGRGPDGLFHPYWDPNGRVWTQGYGETKGITKDNKPWTEKEARARLKTRLNRDFAPYVLSANSKLNQNQLNGFTSFVYNVGPGGVGPTSSVGLALRAGRPNLASNLLLRWNKSGGQVLPGLTARREKERALIRRPVS